MAHGRAANDLGAKTARESKTGRRQNMEHKKSMLTTLGPHNFNAIFPRREDSVSGRAEWDDLLRTCTV